MENQPASVDKGAGSGGKYSSRNYLLAGCAAAVIVLACMCAVTAVGGVVLVAQSVQEPENLEVDYSIPFSVRQGQEFQFELVLRNTGDTAIHVDEIDLDEAFGGSILDGAVTVATQPEMTRDFSIPGIKTFIYNRRLPSEEATTVVFNLKAVEAGEFGGSVGVWVGDRVKRLHYVSVTVLED